MSIISYIIVTKKINMSSCEQYKSLKKHVFEMCKTPLNRRDYECEKIIGITNTFYKYCKIELKEIMIDYKCPTDTKRI